MVITKKRFCILFIFVLLLTLAWAKSFNQNKTKQIEGELQQQQSSIQRIVANQAHGFTWPMKQTGELQSYGAFGKVKKFANKYHSAIDYYATPGTPVYSIADGVVYYSGHERAYGGLVIITHQNGAYYSLYGHVSAQRWLIEAGEEVTKGQLVGYIADTNEGWGIGIVPHLHFSVRLGSPKDYPRVGQGNWMTGYTDKHPVYYQFVDPKQLISLNHVAE